MERKREWTKGSKFNISGITKRMKKIFGQFFKKKKKI